MHNYFLMFILFSLISCHTELENNDVNSQDVVREDPSLVAETDVIQRDTEKQKNEPNCECSLSVSIKYHENGRPYYESPNSDPIGWWAEFEYEPCDLGLTVLESQEGYFRIKVDDPVNKDHWNDSLGTMVRKELLKLDGKWMKGEHLLANFDDAFYGKDPYSEDYNKYYNLFEFPSIDSVKIRTLDKQKFDHSTSEYVKIVGCCREWFFVEVSFNDGPVQGWTPWYHFCSNDCTNCHHGPEEGFPIYGY